MSCSHPSQSPLPPTEEKVAPVASLQPPSYQVAAGVPLPPPPPPEHEDSQLSRCRRRYRRFAPFLVAAVFLWLASRFILLHCGLPKVGPTPLLSQYSYARPL